MLKSARKVAVENSNSPDFRLLPEADIADMEAFLEEIALILPVIGSTFLQSTSLQSKGLSEGVAGSRDNSDPDVDHDDLVQASPVFLVVNKKAGISAQAIEMGGEFIILSGSIGSLKERMSFHDRMKAIRDEAFASGRARKLDVDRFQLEQDIAFSSPSAEAVFLFGTSRNGRTDWVVDGHGLTYGDWKDLRIDQQHP